MRGEFEVTTKYYTHKYKNLKSARKDYNWTRKFSPCYECKLIYFVEVCAGIKIGLDISNNK